jgi:triacylglycerol esterase/lipase EstA (alpha/beta hydrolase family)
MYKKQYSYTANVTKVSLPRLHTEHNNYFSNTHKTNSTQKKLQLIPSAHITEMPTAFTP